MSVSVILERCGSLLEGPHWDDEDQCLYFIDYITGSVHQWDPVAEMHVRRERVATNVGCVVTTKTPGLLAITGKHDFLLLDWASGKVTNVVAEIDKDRRDNHFNDGKCDAAGRFWAGTVGPLETPTIVKPRRGSLYCLSTDRCVTQHVHDVDISNGLCWSHDNTVMYYIDSLSGKVDAFDYCLETGQLSNRRTAFPVPRSEGVPDGMTMDSEGMVWVACFDGWRINRYNPITGERLQTINFPCAYVTSCCFGGKDLDILFVTTSKDGLSEQQLKEQPLAGSLFKVTELNVKGLPSYKYTG